MFKISMYDVDYFSFSSTPTFYTIVDEGVRAAYVSQLTFLSAKAK